MVYFQDKSLTVFLQYKTEGQWTECFGVRPDSGRQIKMPSTAYLGFSAHTGELSDNFDIINVETRNLYNPTGSGSTGPTTNTGGRSSQKPVKIKQPGSGGGWFWFFFKILMFGGVCAGGYYGYKTYKSKQRYKGF